MTATAVDLTPPVDPDLLVDKLWAGHDHASTIACVPASSATWPYQEFAAYLDALERAEGLASDAELARRVGIDQSLISNWRAGKRRPAVRSLDRIADALGVARRPLWRMAGYASDEDADAGMVDLATLPVEVRDLLDLYDGATERQRSFLRASLGALVRGVRAEGDGSPNQARTSGRRHTG